MNIRTTNMLDRERDGRIKFMIWCNITKMDVNYITFLQNVTNSSLVGRKLLNPPNVRKPSLLPSFAQFRKKVQIEILDR